MDDCFSNQARARIADLSAINDAKGVFGGRQGLETQSANVTPIVAMAAE